jgi:hypothetical protein
MWKYIDKLVQECNECYRRKQGKEYKAPLGEVLEPTYPFEITSMEFAAHIH